MKNYLFILFSIVSLGLMAQRPYVNSISPTSGNINETVTITGSGFSTNPADLKVFFGAAEATINSATDNIIEVSVPAGATYDEIMVVNTTSGLSGVSSQFFSITYGGDSFDSESAANVTAVFEDVENIATPTAQTRVYDLCLCDFNSDGLTDFVMTAQEHGSGIAQRLVYRNTSNSVTTSFASETSLAAEPSSNTNCKDLNGDGKPDLVVSRFEPNTGTRDVEVYLNNSVGAGITFTAEDPIVLPRNGGPVRQPRRLELEDIDNDGKPDLIVVTDTDKNIDIYLNTSTLSSITFNTTPTQINAPLPGDETPLGLKLADLNQDVLPDIVITTESNGVYIFENQSTTQNILFKDSQVISTSSADQIRNVEIADFDGNGFPEIMVTNNTTGSSDKVYVFENETNSSGATIQMAAEDEFVIGDNPWGLSVGDLDGDGDVDAAIAMVGAGNEVYLMINTFSATSTIGFDAVPISVAANSRNIKVSDLNDDAKPDLVFTSSSALGTVGFPSYINNRNCVTPEITPSSDEYCPGNSFIVTTTPGDGLTYDWKVGGTTVKSGSDNFYDISGNSADISVTVTTTTDDGFCTVTSSTATFTLNNNTPANPTFTVTSPVCEGETITLTPSSTTLDNYFWTGPNGFTSSQSTPVFTSTASSGGTYSLVIQQNDGCKSQEATQVVNVISTPFPKITNEGQDNFCLNDDTQLTTNNFAGYNYQWSKDGTAISGATSTDLTVTETGNYTVTLIDQSMTTCRDTSAILAIREVDPPVPDIVADNEICVDVPLSLTGNLVSGSAEFGFDYAWDFLDAGNNSIGTDANQNTTFTFTSAGSYTAQLTVAYQDILNCSSQDNHAITATAVPVIPITPNPNSNVKCEFDSLRLEMPAGMVSYLWSTGDATEFTYGVTPAGVDSVRVSVTVVNDIGCTVNSTIDVLNYSDGGVTITSPDATIDTSGTLRIPEDLPSIQLQASGGTNYTWSPGDIFDDSTATTVTVFPKSTQTLITLQGTDINNCLALDTITLQNNNVIGRKSFSPNGDGLGFDCWEILNGDLLDNTCTVYIFDSRGRTIYEGDGPFVNDCAWDGRDVNNKDAPEGIYYYVLKCKSSQNSQFSQSGSILLGR